MRQFSLAIHDLRVSDAESTVATLQNIQGIFGLPLTVHLVCDEGLRRDSSLGEFLCAQSSQSQIEVVFHGLSHQCPSTVGTRLAWYHKFQAEYLLESEDLREVTRSRYQELRSLLGASLGICPPCWLSTPKNRTLFVQLQPAYVESMLSLQNQNHRVMSPIISLGSPNSAELFWLRGLGHAMGYAALLLPHARIRVALHTCDLQVSSSMQFFVKKVRWLQARGVHPVLQCALLQ